MEKSLIPTRSASDPNYEDSKLIKHIPNITNNSKYSCDGRVHCSQTSSGEEATVYISNCSGTKVDGDNDGIPCDSQFC